jgi:serine/threonine protein kinase
MIKEQPYDFQVDVWSLGVIMYELIACYSPFSGQDTNETIQNIKDYQGFSKYLDKLKDFNTGTHFLDMLGKILESDPNKRLTIEEILNHNWFKQIIH